jgi:TatD DNase family protein
MAKKKSSTPPEENLLLPTPPSSLPIVDTHTHIAATFEYYRGRYKAGRYLDVYEFVKAMYANRNVEAVVDVWCEAPVRKLWKEFADSALDREKWGGLEYWFVMGTSCGLLPN